MIGITPIFIVTEIFLQSVLYHRIIAGHAHEPTSLQIVRGRYCCANLCAHECAHETLAQGDAGPPRSWTQTLDPQARGGKQDGGQEVAGGFVVTRGDASEVLEFIEEAFDEIALAVERAVDRALDLAVSTVGM